MADCLDCKHCKVTVSKGILRCTAGHWQKANLNEKIIRLTKEENHHLRIKWREIFIQGEKCLDMLSMNKEI